MPGISETLSRYYFLARNTPSQPSHNSICWPASPPFFSLPVSEFLCLDLDSSLGFAHAHFSLSKYSHCSLSGLQHKKQCSPNILLQTLSRLISLCSHCLHHPKPLTVLKGQCKLHMSYYGPLYTWSICLFLRSATLNNSYSCLMIYIECPFYMKCSLPAWAQLARPLSSLLPSVLCASL